MLNYEVKNTIRFKDSSVRIKVRENRLYVSKEEAETVMAKCIRRYSRAAGDYNLQNILEIRRFLKYVDLVNAVKSSKYYERIAYIFSQNGIV